MTERAISVRLDERAWRMLDELVASGLSSRRRSGARLARAASRRRDQSLLKEASRVAVDPEDRAEMAAIAALMDSLRPDWPPE